MAIEEPQFESLLEQVRDLHRVADQLTRSPRLDEHIQARLSWSRDVPPVPSDQRVLADAVVEALESPRLSSAQSRRLRNAFFGR
ncbi:MAG TPA: hypothetical protein VFT33_06600 [Gaiellaceae bacterium]|nr:hypothetical protein [Gaiellaceae bacterium]